jgi:beta-alanine degradation protein BauB
MQRKLALALAAATVWASAVAEDHALKPDPSFHDGQRQEDSGGGKMREAARAGMPNFKVEFQNDAVSVLRIRMEAHEKTPMHDVSPRLVAWLTDAMLRETSPEGKVSEERYRAGQTIWVPARRHAGENLSDHPIEFLAIVPKESPEASAGGGAPHSGMPHR